MKAIHIALRDLLETFRDWHALIFMVAMPVAFTLFYGVIFNTAEQDPRIAIGYINQDRGALTTTIEGYLEDSETLRAEPLNVTVEEAADLVRREKERAVLVVPQGFSEDLLAGRESSLRLIVDEFSSEGRAIVSGLSTLSTRLLSTVAIVDVGQSAREDAQPFADDAQRDAFVADTIALTSERWRSPTVQIVQEETGRTDAAPTGFGQSSPGMLVQFAIFGLIGPLALLITERRQGTFERLLTTSVSRRQVVAGHMLAILTTIFVQQLLMVLVGQLFLGVDYFHAPLATLAMMLAVCLFSSSLGMLVVNLAKAEEHVTTAIIIIALLLSALGGAWFPLDITGETFNRIGHIFPTAWAMDGFQDIVVRGMGLSAVWPAILILLGYAVVLFGLAIWRLRTE